MSRYLSRRSYLQFDLLLLLWEQQVFISGHLNTGVQCAGPATDRTPCGFINACQRGCSATTKEKKRKRKIQPSGDEGSEFLSKKRLTVLNLWGGQLHARLFQMLKNTQPACVRTPTRGGGCVFAYVCVWVALHYVACTTQQLQAQKKSLNPASEG